MLKILLIIVSVGLFFSKNVYSAVTCSGCLNSTLNININSVMSAGENEVGKVIPSGNVITRAFDFSLNVNNQVYVNEWFAYSGEPVLPPRSRNTSWNFHKVDDYVSIALRYVNNCGYEMFSPFNSSVQTSGPCSHHRYTSKSTGDYWYPRTFQIAMRIDKKIISGSYVKNIFIGEYGICMNAAGNCQNKEAVFFKIFANINVTAPQTCELDGSRPINLDFGSISSGAFKTAGVIANGVQPKARDISIKCDNIDGNSKLTLRLQADKTKGDIVVSDENNDVGFRVTNNSGVPLVPNNVSSVIPFILDSSARQNVTIQAYPVSVTGNKPGEGPVTSRAYLRVDFP